MHHVVPQALQARVDVEWPDAREPVLCDAAGRFAFACGRDLVVDLEAAVGGMRGRLRGCRAAGPGSNRGLYTIVVRATGNLSVSLVAPTNGAARRAEAWVRDARGKVLTRSCDAGACLFEGLAPGEYDVAAFAAGCAARRPDVVVVEPGATTHATIALRAGRTVRGLVRDAATGAAIQGARVGFTSHMHGEVRTNSDGTFVLGVGLGAGSVTVHAYADGYAPAWCSLMDALEQHGDTADDVVVELALPAGCTVVGEVARADGGGAQGASVLLVTRLPSQGILSHIERRAVSCAPDGSFELRGVPLQTGRLYAFVAGAGCAVRAFDGPLTPHGRVHVGTILVGAGAALTVECTYADGGPAVAAQVVARPHADAALSMTATSDERGLVDFAGLPAGPIEVRVDSGHGPTARAEVELTEGGIARQHLTLGPRGATITGVVRPANGFSLPAGVRVVACADDGATVEVGVRADGTFRCSGLEEGREYTVEVQTSSDLAGDAVMSLDSARVTAPARVELGVCPSMPIEGQVQDRAGAPVVGVWVTVEVTATGRVLLQTLSGYDGRFHLSVPQAAGIQLVAQDGQPPARPARRIGRLQLGATPADGPVVVVVDG